MPLGGMDNDYAVDVDEIVNVVRTAEVIVLRFLIAPRRLLIDPRYKDADGPLIALVEPVTSAEERFRSLRRLRPRFRLPERITVVHWPKFVERLETAGVWAAVENRLLAAGYPETAAQAADALRELKRLERLEVQHALTGEGFQTLWEG